MLKLFFCDLWFCLCCCTCVFVSLTLAKVLSWQRKEVRRVKIVRRPTLTWLFSCLGTSLSYCCKRSLSSKQRWWTLVTLSLIRHCHELPPHLDLLSTHRVLLNSNRNIVVNASTIATTTSQQKGLHCLDTHPWLVVTDVITPTNSPSTLVCAFYYHRLSVFDTEYHCSCPVATRVCGFFSLHLFHNQLWQGKQFWIKTAVYTWLPLSKYFE